MTRTREKSTVENILFLIIFAVIDRGNYRTRKTLESWHTANTIDADNNSKPLPEAYLILLN